MKTPSHSGIHAREERPLPSGRLGEKQESPPQQGPETTAATVLVGPSAPGSGLICALCRQFAIRNEILGISFCPAHGFGAELLPWNPSLGRFPRV